VTTISFDLTPTYATGTVLRKALFTVADVTDWAFSCLNLQDFTLANLVDDAIDTSHSVRPTPASLITLRIKLYALTHLTELAFWSSLRGRVHNLYLTVVWPNGHGNIQCRALSITNIRVKHLGLRIGGGGPPDLSPRVTKSLETWATDQIPVITSPCPKLATLWVKWSGDPETLRKILENVENERMPALGLLHFLLYGEFDVGDPTSLDLMTRLTYLSDQRGFKFRIELSAPFTMAPKLLIPELTPKGEGNIAEYACQSLLSRPTVSSQPLE
jgi:hypothetical protein